MTKKEIAKSLCGYPAALNVKETAQILRVSCILYTSISSLRALCGLRNSVQVSGCSYAAFGA